MAQRNFTDSEEVEIGKLYTVGMFGVKQIQRAYGYKYHTTFGNVLRRQGVTIRSNHDNNRLYDLNPHVFDVIDNEHSAYWLGFIYADGCVYNRSLKVALAQKDIDQLEKLKMFLESNHPIEKTLVSASGTNKKYQHCNLTVTHMHLAKQLKSLGIIANRGKFDKCINQIKPDMIQHWIRGLVDGDGSFHSYKPGFSIVGRKPMLEFIRQIFADKINRNPNIKIHKHPTAKIHSLIYMGRQQCQIIAEYLYKDATIWMARKKDTVDNYPLPQKRTRNKLGQWE